MPQNPVEGKSPKNTEKKEFQFLNKENEWQTCRWKWFIEQRKRKVKTRFRLSSTSKWTYPVQEFEDDRLHTELPPGPGRQFKYGEPATPMLVPNSLIPELEKKIDNLKKKATAKKYKTISKINSFL